MIIILSEKNAFFRCKTRRTRRTRTKVVNHVLVIIFLYFYYMLCIMVRRIFHIKNSNYKYKNCLNKLKYTFLYIYMTDNFKCTLCNYSTKRFNDITKHYETKKHKKRAQQILNNCPITCECGKSYKFQSGFSRHKVRCNFKNSIEQENQLVKKTSSEIEKYDKENYELKTLLAILIRNQQEQQRIQLEQQQELIELKKDIVEKVENINVTNNTTINNSFNINVFLNEHCKDAITIKQFLHGLNVSIEDILLCKTQGMVGNMIHTITRAIKDLNVEQRPLHCTDVKRATIYYHDELRWAKDTHYKCMDFIIKFVVGKQFKALEDWVKQQDNFENNEEAKMEYLKLSTILGKGLTDVDKKEFEQIVRGTGKTVKVG